MMKIVDPIASVFYRAALVVASVGGAALSICGSWVLSRGEADTVGHVMIYGGLLLTCGAAIAAIPRRSR